MGSNTVKAYGAQGHDDLLWFAPEALTVVGYSADHPLVDSRVALNVHEPTVLSMMKLGVLTPITIRKNGERDGKPVIEVVDGRQRVKNAIEANKRLAALGQPLIRIPARRTRGDEHFLTDVMIAANELRQDDDVISKARKVRLYIARGRSEEEAATAWGVSKKTIQTWRALDEAVPVVQSAVKSGEISAAVAANLGRLPHAAQLPALEKLRTEGVTKGKKGVEAAERARGKSPTKATKLAVTFSGLEIRALCVAMTGYVGRDLSEMFSSKKEHAAFETASAKLSAAKARLKGGKR